MSSTDLTADELEVLGLLNDDEYDLHEGALALQRGRDRPGRIQERARASLNRLQTRGFVTLRNWRSPNVVLDPSAAQELLAADHAWEVGSGFAAIATDSGHRAYVRAPRKRARPSDPHEHDDIHEG